MLRAIVVCAFVVKMALVALEVNTLESKHPMLYFNARDVADLRQRARTTHKEVDKHIKAAVGTMLENEDFYMPPAKYEDFAGPSYMIEMYGNNLAPLALYCLVHPSDEEALTFVIRYMDNLSRLSSWRSTDTPTSLLPVSHTLTGFATAYDFLYEYLDEDRRGLYLTRITRETEQFYNSSFEQWWGHSYLQNHVMTIHTSLFHGALVVSRHDPTALPWLHRSLAALERNMLLLNHIVDGSLTEGVHYTTYTSRSLTQYVHLVLRHFNVDHTADIWIRNHFWYYYYTTLPGLSRAVGIADTHYTWGYGPESQLKFLDAFVMKSGHGNWLANEIRKRRSQHHGDNNRELEPLFSEKWSTLHTEFIWQDAQLAAKPPSRHGEPDLHIFSDWGLVTYTDSGPNDEHSTFLAFKSGKMHGKAMFDVVNDGMYKSWIRGWKSFNPGHEHPDQNLFIFAPNGKLFITDAMYGPKYSFLNNVLVFNAPFEILNERFYGPWVGQLGECSKWLKWKEPEAKEYGGDIVTATLRSGRVHIAGEAVDAYAPYLGLKSVYRNILLLNKDLLLVLDHIELKPRSTVTAAGAFFHNIDRPFQSNDGNTGARVTIDEENYNIIWRKEGPGGVSHLCGSAEYWSAYANRTTHFVNITFELERKTRMAYVFSSPRMSVTDLRFVKARRDSVRVVLSTDSRLYTVTFLTTHHDPSVRQREIGSLGFVKVVEGKLEHSIRIAPTRRKRFPADQIAMKDRSYNTSIGETPGDDVSIESIHVIALTVSLFCLALLILKFSISKYMGNANLQKLVKWSFLPLFSICIVTMLVIFADFDIQFVKLEMAFDSSRSTGPSARNLSGPSARNHNQLPTMFIMAAPWSGDELVSQMFYHNPDFIYFSKRDISLAVRQFSGHAESTCIGGKFCHISEDSVVSLVPKLMENPLPYLRPKENASAVNFGDKPKSKEYNSASENANVVNIERKLNISMLKQNDHNYKLYSTEMLVSHIRRYSNAIRVMHLSDSEPASLLPTLNSISNSNIVVYVVCDPRNWVANVITFNKIENCTLDILLKHLGHREGRTSSSRTDDFSNHTRYPVHQALARLWLLKIRKDIDALDVIRDHSSTKVRTIMWEKVISKPSETIRELYELIGIPLHPAMEHQILQSVRSGVFRIPYIGVINPNSKHRWEDVLTEMESREIMKICSEIIRKLKSFRYPMNYSP
ncbi:dermatan-sulfate epimerase-like protein [Ptychodera flava]|uniref:dermatan-sulfate epimerase-like protein n=1 Tax=Ptychodera flava TaxID=63121 RepID=UPI00396AB107